MKQINYKAFTLVQAWQDAANSQNIDRLVELSAPTIEVIGPRGSGYGYQLLRDWLARAGLHLITLRAFVRDNGVVVAQRGVWRSVETGEVTGERYDTLDAALVEAGLDYSDEIVLPI